MGKNNGNCASRGIYAYFYGGNSQYEDNELNMEQRDVKLPEFRFLGTAQWSWAAVWNAVDADAGLISNNMVHSKLL